MLPVIGSKDEAIRELLKMWDETQYNEGEKASLCQSADWTLESFRPPLCEKVPIVNNDDKCALVAMAYKVLARLSDNAILPLPRPMIDALVAVAYSAFGMGYQKGGGYTNKETGELIPFRQIVVNVCKHTAADFVKPPPQ